MTPIRRASWRATCPVSDQSRRTLGFRDVFGSAGGGADRRCLPLARCGGDGDRWPAAAFGRGPRDGSLGSAGDLRGRRQAARPCRHRGRGRRRGAARLHRRLRPQLGPGGRDAYRRDRCPAWRRAGRRDPVHGERPRRHSRPGAGQRRHGLAPALHRVDQLARRSHAGPDQGRLPARPARDRRRHGQGERGEPDRGVRRAHRRDRLAARAHRLRSARRRARLAAGAGCGAGGEPVPGRGLPRAGRLQGADAGAGAARLRAGAAGAAAGLVRRRRRGECGDPARRDRGGHDLQLQLPRDRLAARDGADLDAADRLAGAGARAVAARRPSGFASGSAAPGRRSGSGSPFP